MAETAPGYTLGDLLAAEVLGLTVLVGKPDAESRPVRGATLVHTAKPVEVPQDRVLISLHRSSDDVERLPDLLALPGSRIIVVWSPHGPLTDTLNAGDTEHVVLGLPADVDPSELVGTIAKVTASDEMPTRKLTSLQRSLTKSLADPNPLGALISRTAKTCNAVVTIVSSNGTARHSTAPLPLSLLVPEISRTQSEAQTFAVGGWYGLAVRIAADPASSDKSSWLLAASRRESFPDRYSEAAAYIAASLAETSIQIDRAAQHKERAVRSGVLEQVLAMRLERHDAELAGRVASLGISFEQDARAIVLEPTRRISPERDTAALDALYFHAERLFAVEGIANLLVLRENAVIGLVQASAPAIKRTFVKASASSQVLLGIGRDVTDVGVVVDSYHDAQLAVRVLRRDGATRASLCYEDFDFATRLFSNIGLDKMGSWATELLRPLEDQQLQLETLMTYFDCQQNIMHAAKVLMIHHNSLRYRLSKIESALGLNLRDPAAVSSLFLALTALSMVRAESDTSKSIAPGVRSGDVGQARGVGAAGAVLSEEPGRLSTQFGAAVGPER